MPYIPQNFGESGWSGYSGKSGYSGYSGTSGYSGYSGISGFSGYSGISGFSGYSGISGSSGYSGYSGKSGFSGYSGLSGFSGISGFSGYSGISGSSGYSGYSGISGTNGIGSVGASGFSGYSGLSGFSGSNGSSGFSGYSGAGTSGFSGYSGPSGFSGYSGPSGYSGYSGLFGGNSQRYLFNNSTSGSTDPGTNYLSLNNATLSSVTQLSINNTNADGVAISSWTGTFNLSNVAPKGNIRIFKINDSSTFIDLTVSASVLTLGSYSRFTVAYVAGNGSFSSNDQLVVSFVAYGNSGYSGYSGPSGYSGYSGISGYSGYSGAGTSGFSGYSGPSGYSGYSGKSGYSGYSGSGGSPGGSNTQIQYNNSAAFGGITGHTFNNGTGVETIATTQVIIAPSTNATGSFIVCNADQSKYYIIVDSSANRIGIGPGFTGSNTPYTGGNIEFQMTDGTGTNINARTFKNGNGGAISRWQSQVANGTTASPTGITSGQTIGSFTFGPYAATTNAFITSGTIIFSAEENIDSATGYGSNCNIACTPIGSFSATNYLSLNSTTNAAGCVESVVNFYADSGVYFTGLSSSPQTNGLMISTGTGAISYGAITPAGETSFTISADTNNQSLTTTSNIFLITNSTSDGLKITGFANGSAGRKITIKNVGTKTIRIPHESASSTAANRVTCPIANVDLILRPADCWDMIYNNTSSRWEVVAGYDQFLNDITFCCNMTEDFLGNASFQTIGSVIGQNNIWTDISGSSTITNNNNYNANQTGSILMNLSGTGGYCAVYVDNWGNLPGAIVLEARVLVGSLSNATDEYEFRFGVGLGTFSDVTRSSTVNSFTGIRYKRASSVNWQIISRNSSTETATTSSVAVPNGGWARLKVVINTAQSSVEGFIDDVSIGTVSSNLVDYTQHDVIPLVLTLYRTAGNPTPSYKVDYVKLRNINIARRA